MNRITYNPRILDGKAIVQGTRISVDFVLDLLASGMTETEILKEYKTLRNGDVQAVLEYAASAIKREEVVFTR